MVPYRYHGTYMENNFELLDSEYVRVKELVT